MDLCRRVRKAGKKVLFYPKFKIYHGSGESYTDKRLQKSHYYDSMEVYLKKYSKYFSLLMVKLMRKLVIGK
jgi:GT2 family glycosyltransferase